MNLRERCEDLENGILDKCISGDSFSWKSERIIEMLESFAREIESQAVVQWNEKCYQNGCKCGARET